jgi:hypothetical protein
MRNLVAVLTAVLFPAFASAQETKPVPLADYVSFCLAQWADAPDIQAKASALGLQDTSGMGASVTIGKSTLRLYKSTQSSLTFIVTTTTFADGKERACDIGMPVVTVNRADLETMEQALHLDGQILSFSATNVGHWKMPDQRPAVLLKGIITKSVFSLEVRQFEPAAKDATKHH